MDITLTIPDDQWQQFQQLAQEAVETKWNGNYEDFVMYIMMVNLENYIESQKRKQEKKLKRALAEYEESLKKEQEALIASAVVNAESTPVLPTPPVSPATKPVPALSKPPATKRPEAKPKSTEPSNKELSERIAQLEEIPFKRRTMVEAQELNDLLIMRKKRTRKK